MKFTREGRRFLLAAVLIAAAAVNTGNNLIYLILSLMLSFVVLSYLILRINLAGLDFDIKIASPVYAGDPVFAELAIHNNKKVSAYSLVIETADTGATVNFGEVPAMGFSRESLLMLFEKRGEYGYGYFTVRSSFPFILFQKQQPLSTSGTVLVYPRLLDIALSIRDIEGREDMGMISVRGSGDDLYALRGYQEGDDWRRIHWKASARQSSGLLVREYAEYASENVTILLDNLLPKDENHFETAVSLAASFMKYFIEQGCAVRLITGGRIVPFGSGPQHLFDMLDVLSLIDEQETDNLSVPEEKEGVVVAVMKSHQSGLFAYAASADRIFYADTL